MEPRVGGLSPTVREGKKVNAVRVLHSCHPLGWAGGTGPRRQEGRGGAEGAAGSATGKLSLSIVHVSSRTWGSWSTGKHAPHGLSPSGGQCSRPPGPRTPVSALGSRRGGPSTVPTRPGPSAGVCRERFLVIHSRAC